MVSQLRKEKGLTQKEVAQQLFISDKAVSKWERGLSVPDIALLIPLADLLDVTVTELLQCKRQEQEALLDEQQVEALVKTTIQLSEQENDIGNSKKQNGWRCGLVVYVWLRWSWVCFCFGAMKEISAFYCRKYCLPCSVIISVFWFGNNCLPIMMPILSMLMWTAVFRLNLPGVRFHNGNWSYIVSYCRIWTAAALVGYPLLYLLAEQMAPVAAYLELVGVGIDFGQYLCAFVCSG